MGHLAAKAAQDPDQDVVGYICPEVPDVGVIVDRGAASVKAHFAGLERLEGL
jgi:hypothetical protein